jgi:outer membrane protein, adhesin transport system
MERFKRIIFLICLLMVSTSVFATTLRSVLSDTVFSNPEIMIKIKQVLADRARTNQARAGYFPKVDANAGWGIDYGNNVNNGFQTRSYARTDLGLNAKQMLFDGFATRSEVARNVAISNADAYQTWGTAEDIALKAAEAYINVLRTRELVGAAEVNL